MSNRHGRGFDEAAEAFGASDTPERLVRILEALLAPSIRANPIGALQVCQRLTDDAQGDAFAEVLEHGVSLGSDYGATRDFFHAATAYGEARMLARIADYFADREALLFETAGNA